MTKEKKNAWFSSSNFACDRERAKQRQTHKNFLSFFVPPSSVYYTKNSNFFVVPFLISMLTKGQQQKPEIYLFFPFQRRRACLSSKNIFRKKVLDVQRAIKHNKLTRRRKENFVSLSFRISWWKINRWGQTESNTLRSVSWYISGGESGMCWVFNFTFVLFGRVWRRRNIF